MEFRNVGWEITSSFGNLSNFNKDITQTLMHWFCVMLKMGKGWEMAFEVKNEVMGQVTLV
jgi:hypothetical protein